MNTVQPGGGGPRRLRGASVVSRRPSRPRRWRAGRKLWLLWGICGLLLVAGAGASAVSAGDATSAGGAEATTEVGAATAVQTGGQLGTSLAADGLDTPFLDRARSLVGLLVIGLIAWVFSVDRRAVPWRVVIWGVSLQLIFALFILKTPLGLSIFQGANTVVVALLGYTVDGARFIFRQPRRQQHPDRHW